MRSQAIEKLSVMIVERVEKGDYDSLPSLTTKFRILLDRDNGDRAASVIKEVMNNDFLP